MLHGRGDALRLEPLDQGGADRPGEDRVLAEALEVPAAVRRAVQVDGGREHDVHALAAGLVREQPAEGRGELGVPARGDRRGGGDVGRRVALVPQLAADAGGPVGGHHPAQSDRGLVVQRPEVGAGQQPHLLLEGEAGDEGGQVEGEGMRELQVRGSGGGVRRAGG